MRPLKTYFVKPNLPGKLAVLRDLAYNVRWTWDRTTRELFRRLDPVLWESCGHNPVLMLGEVNAAKYQTLENDESFLYQLREVEAEHNAYMNGESTWYRRTHPEVEGTITAYFSAEFGVADCVPIFSGGLGVLAGDHLKSASDMGVPIVGVGLLYQHGYFRQYLNPDGWQQETYPVNDFHTMPVSRVLNASGKHVVVDVPFPGRMVKAQVWKLQVGRNPLYLLDTNCAENSQADRNITSELYGGDQEMRIQQEIVLGMGGVRMLSELGVEPPILHSNEGHAAFLILERIRQLVKQRSLSFDAAREATAASVLFTTHTPVSAGIDVFPRHLVERYFGDYCRDLGISMDALLRLARVHPDQADAGFNMAVLAVRSSYGTNAVSKLHREVSRNMWQDIWPRLPQREVPIGSITNGIHIPSWISNDMGGLFDRYLGPAWREDPRDQTLWESVERIPLEELWKTHERRRERLVAFARGQERKQLQRQGASAYKLEFAGEILDPEALTIGFARRFAPYKRATLMLRDMDRLVRILTAKNRPVQFLFAGKAHPRDHFGKELIRSIVVASKRPELASRIVFLEDYNLATARYLLQGVDVWMNTPRRPKEASGTSGMKAVANGALHLSTKDGWWAEVETEGLGWTIGAGEEYEEDQYDYQDEVEARALYDLLENEVVPCFYQRGKDNIPRVWIRMMKRSMSKLCPVFNSNRMVRQYTERYYIAALRHYRRLSDDGITGARKLAEWKSFLAQHWNNISLAHMEADVGDETLVGSAWEIRAWVRLAPILPQDVSIEVMHGRIGLDFSIEEETAVPMRYVSTDENNVCLFRGIVPCVHGGKHGFAMRILPWHRDLANPYQTGLIKVIEA